MFVNHDMTQHLDDRRAGRLRLPPGEPGEPDRLPATAAAHAQSRLVRNAQRARPREVQARALPARLDLRGLRRPADPPAAETYWGNVNPIGPRGVYDEAKRYAEALTMAYHRQQGVDTCIVRIFNTYGPRMRPHDGRAIPTFIRQALAGQAAHGVRRRLPDAELLLRRRSDPRPDPARRERGAPAGQHRQPRGVDAAAARRDRDPSSTGSHERDRLRGAAGRRPPGAPARHHPGAPGPRMGARVGLEEGLRRLLDSLGQRNRSVSRSNSDVLRSP